MNRRPTRHLPGARSEDQVPKPRACGLRRQSTDAERLLWRHLRDRRLSGFKFRRQYRVPPFIVDFVCRDAMMVIEVDGGQHGQSADYDEARTTFLNKRGFRVLRFWNNAVLENTTAVLEAINEALT